jgi:two-component system cell cycle response regulator DivK
MTRKRILVVEDNGVNLALFLELLAQGDYCVSSVGTAEEAIVAARELPPDLILMDVGLPGMNGLEAIRILKATPETSATCMVALSAFAMPEDVEYAQSMGCDGYITKPIAVHAFRREVARFLGA